MTSAISNPGHFLHVLFPLLREGQLLMPSTVTIPRQEHSFNALVSHLRLPDHLPPFVSQLQVLGFNSQLYANFSEALDKAYGLVGISILLQVRN